jgi:hypothetical protein
MSLTRTGARGEQVPSEIRLVDTDTLVSLSRKGESLGLSGRWTSEQLAENLPRGTRFPIRVILINHLSGPTPLTQLVGSCYRCLVATLGQNEIDSQFSIDLDSVDFENLELMPSKDVLKLTHYLLDGMKIESVKPS